MNSRINLQPIAAPSILGLYALAGSTLIVAANMAGWYGNPHTALYLIPFTTVFGGIAQFAAGMWAYKARDAIATAMHGTWGSLLDRLRHPPTANGHRHDPPNAGSSFPALGCWFIALAAITIMGTIAATAKNLALTLTLGTLSPWFDLCRAGTTLGQLAGRGLGGGRRLHVDRLSHLRLVHGECTDVRGGHWESGSAGRQDLARPEGSVNRHRGG